MVFKNAEKLTINIIINWLIYLIVLYLLRNVSKISKFSPFEIAGLLYFSEMCLRSMAFSFRNSCEMCWISTKTQASRWNSRTKHHNLQIFTKIAPDGYTWGSRPLYSANECANGKHGWTAPPIPTTCTEWFLLFFIYYFYKIV